MLIFFWGALVSNISQKKFMDVTINDSIIMIEIAQIRMLVIVVPTI